jgi:iron(III) transport system substrate-binding protein
MPRSTKRSLLAGAAGALIAFAALPALAGELTVYTAIEADQLAKYQARFNEAHPDITINFVRDSTGVVTAKFLEEADNPQADIVWGLAATSLLLFKTEGLMEAYAPKGVERLDPKMKDRDAPPYWVGMDAWSAVICVNTVESEKHQLPLPTSWKDLTNPVYKGHVVMPNPASSGTGFLDVSSWIQLFGEEEAWKYMDGLHENIAAYTHSGSKPCKQAAAGEFAIGISFEYRAASSKSDGAPIEIVVPSEGIGWDLEAAGIVKGTDNLADAQTLMDWLITDDAMVMYNEGYAVLAVPGLAKPVPNIPPNLVDSFIENDFEWAATNRARILEEWTTRYDAKSEPKS